jgi:hypothetical protein
MYVINNGVINQWRNVAANGNGISESVMASIIIMVSIMALMANGKLINGNIS